MLSRQATIRPHRQRRTVPQTPPLANEVSENNKKRREHTSIAYITQATSITNQCPTPPQIPIPWPRPSTRKVPNPMGHLPYLDLNLAAHLLAHPLGPTPGPTPAPPRAYATITTQRCRQRPPPGPATHLAPSTLAHLHGSLPGRPAGPSSPLPAPEGPAGDSRASWPTVPRGRPRARARDRHGLDVGPEGAGSVV